MCTGLEIAALVGSALSIGGSVYQSQKKSEAAIEQKAMATVEAKQERSTAELYAERIRKQRRQAQAAAESAMVASGVKIGRGTATDITNQIGADAAMDAYLTILGGSNNAGRITEQARINAKALNQSATGDLIQAGGTALDTFGRTSGGGWRR